MPRNRMRRPVTFRQKRKIAHSLEPDELEQLAGQVSYTGKGDHKRNPGDFDLVPSYTEGSDKSLCDDTGLFTVKACLRLLRQGIRRGLLSEATDGDFPKNVWAVTPGGIPVEAALSNRTQGVYHAYPIPDTDPFHDRIIRRWEEGEYDA